MKNEFNLPMSLRKRDVVAFHSTDLWKVVYNYYLNHGEDRIHDEIRVSKHHNHYKVMVFTYRFHCYTVKVKNLKEVYKILHKFF